MLLVSPWYQDGHGGAAIHPNHPNYGVQIHRESLSRHWTADSGELPSAKSDLIATALLAGKRPQLILGFIAIQRTHGSCNEIGTK